MVMQHDGHMLVGLQAAVYRILSSKVVAAGVLMGTLVTFQRGKIERLRTRRRRRKTLGGNMDAPGRRITVVTTAAIPWMTGTAVNPLLRAAYLAHLMDCEVTLLAPWLKPADQDLVFPAGKRFATPELQEECMRSWIAARTGLHPPFKVAFYCGRYDQRMLGIFPVGNPMLAIPENQADVAVLEEPEHLTWFQHGPRWTMRFNHVVGVMHTNYRELGLRNAGFLVAAVSHLLNYALCGVHCDKVIKLSDTVQSLPRQVTECVHGAAQGFLDKGHAKAQPPPEGQPRFSKGAYCLGKVVWGKGWEELLKLLVHCKKCNPALAEVTIDAYGDGEARKSIEGKAKKQGLGLAFLGKRDHLDDTLQDYQVFINASTSDVVATTSMEALAMGKWLICADHPCNHFVANFHNCLIYHSPAEFCKHLDHALSHDPAPLSPATLRELSWEAATERFLRAGRIEEREWPWLAVDAAGGLFWSAYSAVIGIEPLRQMTCGGRGTRDTLPSVLDWEAKSAGAARNAQRHEGGVMTQYLPRLHFSLGMGGLTLSIVSALAPGQARVAA